MGIIGSLGNAVLHSPNPQHPHNSCRCYIHKHAGLGVAVGFRKDDLDGMGSADILKGVGLHRADALAVDLDVGDGITLSGVMVKVRSLPSRTLTLPEGEMEPPAPAVALMV